MDGGFNVVDFMNLQPVERRIMRMVLREITMTYPQLRDAITSMPDDQAIDEGKLTTTLNHLTAKHWLSQHVSGQQTHYRVNSLQRTSSHDNDIWDHIELDVIDQAWSLQLNPQASKSTLSPRSGGKRQLPACIWDCIVDDNAPKGQ